MVVSAATSLDRYLTVQTLGVGRINRPLAVHEQAGGKALHAARAISSCGGEVHAITVAAGGSGATVRQLAEAQSWVTTWIDGGALPTRQCTCVIDESAGTMTEIYEEVQPVGDSTWPDLIEAVRTSLHAAAALVLSGRLPEGTPADGYAALTRMAASVGVPVYVDAAGSTLVGALRYPPTVVKVNTVEAAELAGMSINNHASAHDAATAITKMGVEVAIVTLGRAGVVAVCPSGAISLVGPEVPAAFPVGSGDSFLGGLVMARNSGNDWPAALSYATAVSIANATCVEAADIDLEVVTELVPQIQMSLLHL